MDFEQKIKAVIQNNNLPEGDALLLLNSLRVFGPDKLEVFIQDLENMSSQELSDFLDDIKKRKKYFT